MPELTKRQSAGSSIIIEAGGVQLEGTLCIPAAASGIVIFVHGSGSSRLSPRNQFVAAVLNRAGLGTLLFDLLTATEEKLDSWTGQYRFDVTMLSERVVDATKFIVENEQVSQLKIGYFGASTGAAAALIAAAHLPKEIHAIVSRGGRPDLAGKALAHVVAPTLFIVGQQDPVVLERNRQALIRMPAASEKMLQIIAGATHLFNEPGTLEAASDLACQWFIQHL